MLSQQERIMGRIRVLPYKPGSASAKLLANALGGKRLRAKGSKFRGRPADTIINWGRKEGIPQNMALFGPTILNKPGCIPVNKLDFYEQYPKLVPEFSTSIEDAKKWLAKDGNPKVVCRTLLNASGGRGITIASNEAELIPARVYVKYIKKLSEFRIHFMRGEIIFVQQKRKRNGNDDANFEIRNHDNGFVFCHKDVELPWQVKEIGEALIGSTKLDFGGIDVLFNQKRGKAYILEVNTAPGLEGTTLDKYVEDFRKAIEE